MLCFGVLVKDGDDDYNNCDDDDDDDVHLIIKEEALVRRKRLFKIRQKWFSLSFIFKQQLFVLFLIVVISTPPSFIKHPDCHHKVGEPEYARDQIQKDLGHRVGGF